MAGRSRGFVFLLLLGAGSTFVAQAGGGGAYTVTSAADSGAGSLRDAIDLANGDGGPSTIGFDGSLAGLTIAPTSQLPFLIEDGTTIDGDFGGDCAPDIVIDGAAAGASSGIVAAGGGGHTIRGLSVVRFFYNGIEILSDGNVVTCNRLGIDLVASPGFGNGNSGVMVQGSDNLIGPGNVVENNAQAGVRINETDNGGYPDFVALVPDYVGIFPQISFTEVDQVFQTSDMSIVPLDGGGRPFTEHYGLRLSGELVVGAAGSYDFTIDPLDDEMRLTVGGVELINGGGPGPLMASTALGAGAHTLRLEFVEFGGAASLGLAIAGPGSASLNTNQQAVCATGQPGLCGELFQLRVPSERNRITQNRTANNTGPGIALSCCFDSIPNDVGDVDLGPNTWLNHPVMGGLSADGGGQYTLSGTAPPDATIEVFEAVTDLSGFGEGGSLHGTAVADGGGNFSLSLGLSAQPGVLTATATDSVGNTSEFGPNFAFGGTQDTVSVESGVATAAGAGVGVRVFVRDAAFTPLGLDRSAGEFVQGLALRVDFPPGTVSAANIAPSGIAGGLTPLFGPNSSFNGTSVNYLVSYAEGANTLPFTLDAALPGDAVATLNLMLAPDAPVGTLTFTLHAATELSNQAGTIAENQGSGSLALVHGSVEVLSNAPIGLYANAESTSTVRLTWFDPQSGETGFRVERSTDGSVYVPVQTLGGSDTEFLDTGLDPATLYYYRVVTLIGASDGHASNRATASTFPAVAANICIDAQSVSRRWARSPDVAFRGPEWALVYHDRDDGLHEHVYFERLDGNTLAPLGPRTQVTDSPTSAQFPAIAWNGTHYAVTWIESLRGAPGSLPLSGLRFAQLDADGTLLRGPRRMDSPPPILGFTGSNEIIRPQWDGTHWGLFIPEYNALFPFNIVFRRLAANGDAVLGPVIVASSATHFQFEVAAAFQPLSSEYGLIWVSQRDDSSEILFQRVEEADGTTQLGSPAVVSSLVDWSGTGGTALVADPAGGWLAAWVECDNATGECATWSRRIDASGVPHAGGKVRVSDAGPVDEGRVRLVARPGGYAAFLESFSGGVSEIGRYHLDATGVPDGSGLVPVSSSPGRHSARSRLAGDGTRALVAWSESATTMEVAGRLSDGVSGTLGGEVAFTSGHDPANTAAVVVPSQPRMAALTGGGFVATWEDPALGSNDLHGRIYDASGTLVADLMPLTATAVAGRHGLASAGTSFAVVFRAPGGLLQFARYDQSGGELTPETLVGSGVGGGPVELGWDGEAFAAVYNQGPSLRYLRIDEFGVTLGAPVTLDLALPSNVNGFRVAWMGDGWALVYRLNADGNIYYARFDRAGAILLPPTQISAVPPPFAANPDLGLVFNGVELAITWTAFVGADPPFNENFFTVLERDGSKVFPEVALIPGDAGDPPMQLYFGGGRFHLVYVADNQGMAGMREIDIDLMPGGAVVAGSRFLANRGSTAAGTAHNGATLALAWRVPQAHDIHFQTDACLADPTPPPCPDASLTSMNDRVRLSWAAVADPESGIWRHHLYRDGRLLAEIDGTATQFDDAGYDTATTHSYELRAMNRAFQESVGCPVQSFSTLVGDANGNGTLEVADIFHLINYTLASGPPPLGDADANGDGMVSVTDVFFLINYFFGGGPLPTVAASRG